ncbi:MAG: histidinol-phosphate transaminase [Thermodesulfobacteriota bacterium]
MDPKRRLLPQVEQFTAYTPGLSIDEIRERFGLANVIKMASNENPLGAPPLARKALERAAAQAFRYPQSGNPRLARALGRRLGADPGRIVTGNGSDELIDLLIRVAVRPGRDNILAFSPCFSIYELQSRLCGVELRQAPLNPDFSFPWDRLLALADENSAICFVTTPDNPSGYAPPVEELAAFARRLPENCLLVVDEAYMDFAEPQSAFSLTSRLDELPGLCILRTFSKMYGLAGLRLGYAVLPPWLADAVMRVKLPFSVNLLAEEAGLAALADADFIRCTRDTVLRGRQVLASGLAELGCAVRPSQANFLLFDLPAGAPLDAAGFFDALLRRGVIIRPLKSYNLPNSLRVSVGNDRENALFLEAAKDILHA